MPDAEIISIGTELLMGEITDTNSRFLAGELRTLGIELKRVTTAGDDRSQLGSVLREAITRTHLVIASGGLGPTEDDLTRDCLAEVLGERLAVDPRLEQGLRDFFAHYRQMKMPAHNLRQAMLIPSAKAVPNPNGTAPGWWVEKDGRTIILLPGPPREMAPMWRNEIKPLLQARFPDKIALTRTLKVFGMGEATVDEAVAPVFHLGNPELGIYAKPDGVHLRLIARGNDAAELITKTDARIRNILKEHVWGADEETLPAISARLLTGAGLTLAVFDSGTGGILSSLFAEVEGTAGCYAGSLITNNGNLATRDVPEGWLKESAINAEAAVAMACHVRERFISDIGLGITGIAGMDDDSKPAGIAFIGLDDGKRTASWRQTIIPRRDLARNQLAMAVLFRLRERLIGNQAKL